MMFYCSSGCLCQLVHFIITSTLLAFFKLVSEKCTFKPHSLITLTLNRKTIMPKTIVIAERGKDFMMNAFILLMVHPN